MICVVIKESCLQEIKTQLTQVDLLADLAEIRLDSLEHFTLSDVQDLLDLSLLPLILTLRSEKEGGEWKGSEPVRQQMLLKLSSLHPAYLDLEASLPSSLLFQIKASAPKTQLILSTHDFEKTPEDLDALFQEMQQFPADIYKCAYMAKSTSDALRLILWKRSQKHTVLPVSMGPMGQISRLLSPYIGNPFTYACIDEARPSAPGQISAEKLRNAFGHLHPQTQLFGLIGDPVVQSEGDVIHNAVFQRQKKDAVYFKMQVKKEELPSFLDDAKLLFSGLSVTIPHKETIIPLLDEIDPEALLIGAVNTLCFRNGKIWGSNTDAEGAALAIEKRLCLKGKKVALIGAGGAARAVAYACMKRGADVALFNRSKERALKLAEFLGCSGFPLDKIDHFNPIDLLINATSHPLPMEIQKLSSRPLVMDLHPTQETLLLKTAKHHGCQTLHGKEMFLEQAALQYQLWFSENGSYYFYK